MRPGVGANDGVAEFLRRREGMPWDYDHPLERHALERSLEVIMFQDQVVQLGMDVGGFTAAEADRMRRAFGRRNGAAMVESYRLKFLDGAGERGVPEPVAEAVFGKFNPHYMFPEGHALAFAFTAYQMAWLRATTRRSSSWPCSTSSPWASGIWTPSNRIPAAWGCASPTPT